MAEDGRETTSFDNNEAIEPRNRFTINGNNTRETRVRFTERISGREFDLVLDDYIEEHNNDAIPRIHSYRGEVEKNKFIAAISRRSSRCETFLEHADDVVTIVASCLLTYSIIHYEPFLPSVAAQAIVVIIVLITCPELSGAAGAGAYAGMGSRDVIINYGWLSFLAVVVSICWLVFNRFRIFLGYGGRIGTCVFPSTCIVALIAMLSGKVPWNLYGDIDFLWAQKLELYTSIFTVLASTVLSTVVGTIRLHSGVPLNPMQTPTVLVLLCVLILWPATGGMNDQIAHGLVVGSYVSMASTERLSTTFDFTGAGFVAGLFDLLLTPFFIGFGGRDGFAAFCGFLTYVSVSKLMKRLMGKRS